MVDLRKCIKLTNVMRFVNGDYLMWFCLMTYVWSLTHHYRWVFLHWNLCTMPEDLCHCIGIRDNTVDDDKNATSSSSSSYISIYIVHINVLYIWHSMEYIWTLYYDFPNMCEGHPSSWPPFLTCGSLFHALLRLMYLFTRVDTLWDIFSLTRASRSF